ncbi:TIGR04255 family protein [Asticcacaulis sp. 201]|uniref:TIGR04255 family protein n=1 Tax=Asticcacaulis sp. 201 TaxID=3028787 RepID=UPI002916FA0D|nr:TIGR04255 family protein [Asticcacaulis sp. 201]MDV6333077.1 TIGR04255 family protein [Asticcacaulis sp. 201]
MTQMIFDPFENAYDEVPLTNAPVVRAICQVQFPPIIKVSERLFIADFQDAIRSFYPIFIEDVSQVMTMLPTGAKLESLPVWRFFDVTQAWRVSLTQNFLTIETTTYKSRHDFLDKVGFVLGRASETIKPSHALRIGIRYINHLEHAPDEKPSNLLREDLCATYGSIKSGPTNYMMSEVFLATDVGSLRSKWGFLPPNSTHDVENMQPKAAPSSFLDIDAFVDHSTMTVEFEPHVIVAGAEKLSAACYNFFRWRVNDTLIESKRASL